MVEMQLDSDNWTEYQLVKLSSRKTNEAGLNRMDTAGMITLNLYLFSLLMLSTFCKNFYNSFHHVLEQVMDYVLVIHQLKWLMKHVLFYAEVSL